jgi:murein DD-endopeptidase MepM/ murein hydrolase activator NlpD
MGRAWFGAGRTALAEPVEVRFPLRETGFFTAEEPSAVGYRLDLTRGRTLDVDVQFESPEPTRLFVDLFELRDGQPKLVASLGSDTTSFRHEVRRDGVYLLRLQPELLGAGRYTVVQRTVASIAFPIPGLDTRAIQSRFGVERDGGRRTHEGVDIFARRLTPVVAVRDGIAQQSTNRLGGNVVWLHDYKAFRRYYYAHLDFWAFKGVRTVSQGDTLGFVGNTGNAVTTPPHLHFGIYEMGAVNPFPFLAPDDRVPGPSRAPLGLLASWVRVTGPRGNLRAGPAGDAASREPLARGAVGQVEAIAGNMLRIRLPDGTAGYVSASRVRATEMRLGATDSAKAPGAPQNRSGGDP